MIYVIQFDEASQFESILFDYVAGRAGGAARSTISHQSSITSQVDVVEDRKALR